MLYIYNLLFYNKNARNINQNNRIQVFISRKVANGICDELSKISNPTLIKPGTDDVTMAPANSLIIAGKIPGAWLVQIKDAGHAVMVQYPDEINKILQPFLSPTPEIVGSFIDEALRINSMY